MPLVALYQKRIQIAISALLQYVGHYANLIPALKMRVCITLCWNHALKVSVCVMGDMLNCYTLQECVLSLW